MSALDGAPVTLAEVLSLCPGAERLAGAVKTGTVRLHGVTDDSRAVAPGLLFIAVQGDRADGHDHIEAALAAGSAAVFCERALPELRHAAASVYRVPYLRERRSMIAELVYGNPSAQLKLLGVTGTNGKTSTAWFATQLAGAVGYSAGYVGTIGTGVPGALRATVHTTPPATALPAILREFVDAGLELAAIEVSSHALAQGRVEAVEFDVAVLTNFSRDHLDYHRTEEAYAAAKLKLFEHPELGSRIANGADRLGQLIVERYDDERFPSVLTFAPQNSAAVPALGWSDLRFLGGGISGRWHWQNQQLQFELPLLGEFAVANVAAAMLALLCIEPRLTLGELVDAGRTLAGVPGRMEAFYPAVAPGPTVIVDYAHTPDALHNALTAVRLHCAGRLWAVFGCGGDRDPGKRPQMGAAAAALADEIVVTSDNPRSEDPLAIIRDVEPALAGHGRWRREPDRRLAITETLAAAGVDDVVLVAGKGHEDYQEVAGQRLPMDDRALVRALLEKR